MSSRHHPSTLRHLTVAAALVACLPALAAPPPQTFALEYVSRAATGFDMNDQGEVLGSRYTDADCGFSCLPPQAIGVWRDGRFLLLPGLPGRPVVLPKVINGRGLVAGAVGTSIYTADTTPVLWVPSRAGYTVIDLGAIPGTVGGSAVGVDDGGRVVGSSTRNFPQGPTSWVWTKDQGLVDLTTLGFPSDTPVAISPGGTVATQNGWYDLDVPGVVHPLAALPASRAPVATAVDINDQGVQARFLRTTNSSPLLYPYRYDGLAGTWQQLSTTPVSLSSLFGLGGINAVGSVTVTLIQTGHYAPGPDQLASPLSSLLAPAYGPTTVTHAGAIDASGEILAQALVGRSNRLVRLVPVEPCTQDCARVEQLDVRARFLEDPAFPGSCVGSASTLADVRMIVTDEQGTPLPGARVRGHFLDDYWLDDARSGVTDAQGFVRFVHRGPPCVGAIAFLVDDVTSAQRTFDRHDGVLTDYAIPQP